MAILFQLLSIPDSDWKAPMHFIRMPRCKKQKTKCNRLLTELFVFTANAAGIRLFDLLWDIIQQQKSNITFYRLINTYIAHVAFILSLIFFRLQTDIVFIFWSSFAYFHLATLWPRTLHATSICCVCNQILKNLTGIPVSVCVRVCVSTERELVEGESNLY